MSKVKTRFAPSPTGSLHIGGARTALFNWLYAKRHGGEFALRVEDTDRERSKQEYTDLILDGLQWLGIDWDEGPVFQSQRDDYYAGVISRLRKGGHCYHCFCSAEDLDRKRKQAQAEGTKAGYDGICRDLGREPADGEKAVLRFRSPQEGQTVVHDLIRGDVAFENREMDDMIIVRSDGTPTYHLVVVADDLDMGITHALRGEDHLTNTPKQINIFRALGAEPPLYGHMPLILGKDRSRLSKRHGATAVTSYRDKGVLPSAMVNYLARLGWSHGDQEIFTTEELCALFDVGGVGKSGAAFDPEKLNWVNAQHMKTRDPVALGRDLMPWFDASARQQAETVPETLAQVVEAYRERAKDLRELAAQCSVYFTEDFEFDPKGARKFLNEDGVGRLEALVQALSVLETWDEPSLQAAFESVLAALDVKLGKLAQPVRVALTGGTVSPGIYDVLLILGKERVLARINRACEGAKAGSLALRGGDS